MTGLTLEQAQALAERTLAAIDALDYSRLRLDVDQADRERVASDLEGLRAHHGPHECRWSGTRCHDGRRYTDGLLRTAKLYGVEP